MHRVIFYFNLQMATFSAKVNSFHDYEQLLQWAETLEIHKDPVVLARLEALRSAGNNGK